ncbi:MAG: translation elongation factor Ts [Enterobacteriaceae bacterium]
MKNIIDLIKEMRKITKISILDCKKLLIKNNYDINLAIRESNKIFGNYFFYNDNQFSGIVITKSKNNFGSIIKLSCLTDFVSRNELFFNLGKEIVNYVTKNKIKSVNLIKKIFSKKINTLSNKFKENINISKFKILNKDKIFDYSHYNRIGCIMSCVGENNDLLKKIVMHIASNNPIYISKKNIPKNVLEKEYLFQMNNLKKIKKNDFIKKRIVDGMIKKFVSKITLEEQRFIFDESKKIKNILKDNDLKINKFYRFEILCK